MCITGLFTRENNPGTGIVMVTLKTTVNALRLKTLWVGLQKNISVFKIYSQLSWFSPIGGDVHV